MILLKCRANLSQMARDFNMELLSYPSPYSNGITKNTAGHIPRTPPPSPPPNSQDCRVPPISLEDIPEFLLCKDSSGKIFRLPPVGGFLCVWDDI